MIISIDEELVKSKSLAFYIDTKQHFDYFGPGKHKWS
jgi:hypothetical protein